MPVIEKSETDRRGSQPSMGTQHAQGQPVVPLVSDRNTRMGYRRTRPPTSATRGNGRRSSGGQSFEQALRGKFCRRNRIEGESHSQTTSIPQPENQESTEEPPPLDRMTAWFLAAVSTGEAPMVDLVLQMGLDPNTRPKGENSPMSVAAYHGFIDVIRVLLNHGANVNIKDDIDDHSALHVACLRGHFEIVKLLIEHGADIHARMKTGATTLIQSVLGNSPDIVRYIMNHGGSLDAPNGFTALHHAVRANFFESAAALVSCGMSPCIEDKDGVTPLALAAVHADSKMVKMLLESETEATEDWWNAKHMAFAAAIMATSETDIGFDHCQKINLFLKHGASSPDDELKIAICVRAIQSGHLPLLARILDAGCPLDQRLSVYPAVLVPFGMDCLQFAQGRTLLGIAAGHSDMRIALLLMDRGADINAGLVPPLGLALGHKNKPLAQLLLQKGASKHVKSGYDESTCLHVIVTSDLEHASDIKEMMELLIHDGLSINSQDKLGLTALHLAVVIGNMVAAEVLIELGIDVDACTDCNETALILACKEGKEDMVHVLIEKGKADVLKMDDDGACALTFAIDSGSVSIVQYLLEHGADVHRLNEHGETCLHYAAENGTGDTIQLLLDYGANIRAIDMSGWTPLMTAVYCEDTDAVRVFLEAQADVDVQDKQHKTALHLAVCNGDTDTVVLLLQYGADPSMTDDDSQTALMIAEDIGEMEMVTRMRECIEAARDDMDGSAVNVGAQNLGDGDDFEQLLTCPITLDIMRDPVVAPDGYSYERKAITKWLCRHGTSPMTQRAMSVKSLMTNRALKYIADRYLKDGVPPKDMAASSSQNT